MKLYSYNNGSASARALADALDVKIVKHEGKLLNMKGQAIINWGSSHIERDMVNIGYVYNHPVRVASAVNKLTAFQVMQGQVAIPEWTEELGVASKWLVGGFDVVIRYRLNGHSGEGIEVVTAQEWEDGYGEQFDCEAPLYTKYIKKQNEWRVHVFGDEPLFVQQKKRKLDVPDDQVNWQVRNHQNGFIYANQHVEAPEAVLSQAQLAVAALGLDFGAVDVIEKKDGSVYVLEVNCAPGLSGATLEAYVKKFKEI